ncbi:MAG: 4'-phosphopantetheinyl transferase superfamily protein [Longimicrobiales bacterium]|nr:4'-phosphopantetheinyl transferase superfamily protein [Longimicrobiales bacterium]
MSARMTIATATDGPAAKAALTATEARECALLAEAARRRDFRAGRLAAKRAAQADLHRSPCCRIEVVGDRDGAPELRLRDALGGSRRVSRALSLSHRDGHAVAVTAPSGTRIGVDLERAGSVQLSTVQELLTPFELEIAHEVDPTVIWSVKEAAWKALGLGTSVEFAEVELRADPMGRLIGIDVLGAFVPMHTRIAEPWPGFICAKVWMTGGVA